MLLPLQGAISTRLAPRAMPWAVGSLAFQAALYPKGGNCDIIALNNWEKYRRVGVKCVDATLNNLKCVSQPLVFPALLVARLLHVRAPRSIFAGGKRSGMWSVECGMRSVECGMRSVECGVRNVECGMRNVE